jgi:histidine triad (HIT) family protein
MYNHAPGDYACPFCQLVNGGETAISDQDDIVVRDEFVTAFMAGGGWPNNKGHVLVVPNVHYENVYDLPPELGAPIQQATRSLALAFKATYGCDGVSTRQHNEPHGNQDVWHYHVHVFPRYENDHLYLSRRQNISREERAMYARKLRQQLRSGEWL